MPKEGGHQGHSVYTPGKQRNLDYILRVHMQIVKGIASRGYTVPIYYYFDLTAGSGRLHGEPGSPLIATHAAAVANLSFRAWLFEEHAEAIRLLQDNLQGQPGDLHFIEGNHNETVPQIAAGFGGLKGRRYGIVYWDGNADARFPIDTIRSLTTVPAFAPLDVLLYLSATSRKRVREAERLRGSGAEPPRLEEDLRAIGKRHIIIREPQGAQQWSFAILTDWPGFPKFKRHGFYPIDGDTKDAEHGRAILERLNLTAAELGAKYQPRLQFDAPEEEAEPYFQLPAVSPPSQIPGDPRPGDDEGRRRV